MLKELLFKLERFLRKSDPAFLIKQKERESYEKLLNSYQEEASYYSGRKVSKEEILEKGRDYAKRQELLSMGHFNRCPNCHAPLVPGDPAGCRNCDLHGGSS